LTGKPVSFDDVDARHVVDRTPIDSQGNTVVSIKPANDRKDLFCQFLALGPVLKK
jgi:hypothetical protein